MIIDKGVNMAEHKTDCDFLVDHMMMELIKVCFF